MRADNRQLAAAAVTILMLAAALPAVCSASAMGTALWSKADFSAFTTLGILRVQLSTARDDHGLRLDQFKLDLDGKELRIPAGVDLRVRDPELNSVVVTTTRSITCIEECLDPTGLPIWVDLPYGEYAVSHGSASECEYSMLRIDIEAEGITEITNWECVDGRQVEHVLYKRKGAGDR